MPTKSAGKSPGFLREGFHELGRKLDRRKLRNQSQKLDAERRDAAMRLGECAWREKVGVAEQPGLKAQIEALESRAGAVAATGAKLQQEKAALDARERDERAKYDAQRGAIDAKKRPVDEALAVARQRLGEQTRAAERSKTQLASLTSELSALEIAPAATATGQQAEQLAQREARKLEVAAAQKHAAEQLASAHDSLPSLVAEVTRLEGESRQLAAEIQQVESDRKAALAPILAELNRVAGETTAAQKEATSVADARRSALTQLGLALYDARNPAPALAPGTAEIAAIDARRASTQAALDVSLTLTRSMAPGTMLKFWSAFVIVPVLLVGLFAGTFFAWSFWRGRQADRMEPPPLEETNPYLRHPLARHPAYVLADKLAKASSEKEVADLMLEAFKTIHLGVYTADGRQIVAGSERSDRDFFLYDFEVRILAHAFFAHNVTNFDDESSMIGATLVRANQPESFVPVLKQQVGLRYQRAVEQPDRPMSFLILLVDGLARRQVNPYSLNEVSSRSGKELYLDPMQSFLILLDSFIKAPANTRGSLGSLFDVQWNEFGVVHAEGPCGNIKGKGEAGDWGELTEAVGNWAGRLENSGEIAQGTGALGHEAAELAEKTGKVASGVGTVMDVAGAVHDLIWLYAVTIRIQPSSYSYHWNHGGVNQASFLATVTYELKDSPKGPIPCGAAAGVTLPESPQRLKGVNLMWTFEPFNCLQLRELTPEQAKNLSGESHSGAAGSLSGALGLQTTTGEDGTSELQMDVSCACPSPPWRGTRSDAYMVTASTRSVSSKLPSPVTSLSMGWATAVSMILNRLPGGVEYVMGGRAGYARFSMDHHLHGPYGE